MSSNNAALAKPHVGFGPSGFEIRDLDGAYRFAECIIQSGLAPRGFDKPQQVIVALQYGAELGLAPMQAMQSIAVINGRPSIYGDGLLALVLRQPDCLAVDEQIGGDGDARLASCLVKRKGRVDVIRHFSVADAKKAGLWGKAGPWTQYPDRMLQMRARSFAIRDSYADALRGFDVAEAVEDIPPIKTVASKTDRIREAARQTQAGGGNGASGEPPTGDADKQPPDPGATAGTPHETPADPPAVPIITAAQLKRLHAIRNDKALVTKQGLEVWLFERGVESSAAIPTALYDEAVSYCETGAF